MGIFDKLKRNNKKQSKANQENKKQEQQLPFELKYALTEDDNLQIDFYDNEARFGDDYDTTRLVVSKYPATIGRHRMCNCNVSWYQEGDTVCFDEETGKFENIDAQNDINVLAELDISLLQNDPKYCQTVMKKLLKKQDVQYMHEVGMQETPERPCGKYIGGVTKTETGYATFFDRKIGEASHNSEEMIKRRQQHREEVEAKRQKRIQEKRREIEKLQKEIDEI